MALACLAANRTGSLVFFDDMTADRNSQMNSEVYSAIQTAQIQPNATKLIKQCFTVRIDNIQNMAKATQQLLKAKKWNFQLPDLNPFKHAFLMKKT